MIRKSIMILTGLALLGGCADKIADLNREPHLTPVGSGLNPNRTPMAMQGRVQPPRQDNSFWQDASADQPMSRRWRRKIVRKSILPG